MNNAEKCTNFLVSLGQFSAVWAFVIVELSFYKARLEMNINIIPMTSCNFMCPTV